jgi:uncharacterized lipoprotein NlpE involved in copper resistance
MAAASAFNPVVAETADAKDSHQHEQHKLEWSGIYQGFTPCADCIGVKTTLALNKNETYLLITQFAGKSEREFVEKGKFSWDSNSNTIALTPRNSSTTSLQYAVGDNLLTQLDSNGKRFTGKLAEKYVLRRNDVTEKSPSHAH